MWCPMCNRSHVRDETAANGSAGFLRHGRMVAKVLCVAVMGVVGGKGRRDHGAGPWGLAGRESACNRLHTHGRVCRRLSCWRGRVTVWARPDHHSPRLPHLRPVPPAPSFHAAGPLLYTSDSVGCSRRVRFLCFRQQIVDLRLILQHRINPAARARLWSWQ